MRKIIHIDMDCFYAAIEVRDNPALRNKPVAVGSPPNARGVLCTANYIARKYGVKAALSSSEAMRRCPHLIIVPVNFKKYTQETRIIRDIFAEYTDCIEPLSLDEAFLDVTDCPLYDNNAARIAFAIRQNILNRCQLTASAGIAPNKFLAKIASDWHKPNGQCMIRPEAIPLFMQQLPVNKIYGVGKVSAEKLHTLGIYTCGQLQTCDKQLLLQRFGNFGTKLHQLSFGIDDRPVISTHHPLSVSVEHTFPHDLPNIEACLQALPALVALLAHRIQPEHQIEKLCVKIKFDDFTQTTAECLHGALNIEIWAALLREAWNRKKQPVRLLGIGFRLPDDHAKSTQLPLHYCSTQL